MSAVVLAFKRPEASKPHGDEPKRMAGCWLSADKLDEISRYLLSPEVPYEIRIQWLNGWRTEWKLEPLEYEGGSMNTAPPAPTFAPEIQELIDIASKLNHEELSGVLGIARTALQLPKETPHRAIQGGKA